MILSIRVYKVRKSDRKPEYKTYRYANFDTLEDATTFELKFNHAFDVLKEEINQDRENNDMNLYEPIEIVDVWLS